jgi:hypothetical protein
MEDMDLGLLLRSALPIDDIDQLLMPPNDGMSIIWVDISQRPDLAALAERSAQEPGYAVCTFLWQSCQAEHAHRVACRHEAAYSNSIHPDL